MNNHLSLKNHITRLRDGRADAGLLEQIRRARLEKYEIAKVTRPNWINVQTALDGVAGKMKTAYSEQVDYDLILLGKITNQPALQLRISRVGDRDPSSVEPVDAGALAGFHPGATGMNAPLYDEVSVLQARDRIAVEFLNVTGINNQMAYLVWQCLRVASRSEVAKTLSAHLDNSIIETINRGAAQRTKHLKMKVPFAGGGVEVLNNRESEEDDQPLLITGATTKLQNCFVQLFDPSGSLWSPSPVPVWAVAGHQGTRKTHWIEFAQPFFLPPNTALRGNFSNGINGVYDAAGEITFRCVTP